MQIRSVWFSDNSFFKIDFPAVTVCNANRVDCTRVETLLGTACDDEKVNNGSAAAAACPLSERDLAFVKKISKMVGKWRMETSN